MCAQEDRTQWNGQLDGHPCDPSAVPLCAAPGLAEQLGRIGFMPNTADSDAAVSRCFQQARHRSACGVDQMWCSYASASAAVACSGKTQSCAACCMHRGGAGHHQLLGCWHFRDGGLSRSGVHYALHTAHVPRFTDIIENRDQEFGAESDLF